MLIRVIPVFGSHILPSERRTMLRGTPAHQRSASRSRPCAYRRAHNDAQWRDFAILLEKSGILAKGSSITLITGEWRHTKKLGDQDSNLGTQIQSLMSCRWTIPQIFILTLKPWFLKPGFFYWLRQSILLFKKTQSIREEAFRRLIIAVISGPSAGSGRAQREISLH